ncbi:MAG: response regulator transcription factor, partial [Acidimicrobiales bacterium]
PPPSGVDPLTMHDVLVVDDEPAIRTLVAVGLADAGLVVREAANGHEARDELGSHPPAAMVLDVMMPGMDGFGLLRERRRLGLAADTRVVMLTSRTSERDFLSAWRLGVDEYLTKPFDIDRLVATTRELMATSPAVLARRREAELARSELLERVEAVFARPGVARPGEAPALGAPPA